jgi:hypothetical protein
MTRDKAMNQKDWYYLMLWFQSSPKFNHSKEVLNFNSVLLFLLLLLWRSMESYSGSHVALTQHQKVTLLQDIFHMHGGGAHIFFLHGALFTVVGIWDAHAPADDTSPLIRSVVALVTHSNKSGRADVGITDRALAITLLTQSSDCYVMGRK